MLELGKIRAFLSLNLGKEEIRALRQDQAAIKHTLGSENIRWEDPDKYHLTLRFLGDIDEDIVEPLSDTLDRLKLEIDTIDFETEKIGFFPNRRFPNIMYAGLKEYENNSEALVSLIDKVIYNFEIIPDKKFIPHITFGRFSRKKRVKINASAEFSLSKIKIGFDSFSLMRSKLMPSGSEYEEISKFNFNK